MAKARIYMPAKSAMQSGKAKYDHWVLEYIPQTRRGIERIMGWTSAQETLQQVKLCFSTLESAVAYVEEKKIPYEIQQPKARKLIIKSYADNFAFNRIRAYGQPVTQVTTMPAEVNPKESKPTMKALAKAIGAVKPAAKPTAKKAKPAVKAAAPKKAATKKPAAKKPAAKKTVAKKPAAKKATVKKPAVKKAAAKKPAAKKTVAKKPAAKKAAVKKPATKKAPAKKAAKKKAPAKKTAAKK